MSEESIFAEALEKPADERAAYLDKACGGDAALRARVEGLLEAHNNPDSIFDSPANTEAATTVPSPNLPKRLGDFEIIQQIGRGGMGIVYEARQVSLNRRVALKALSSGLGLTAKAVMRFRREAEAAAKLHHTNIVPIYATGEDGGVHFYAMELVEGPSLDKVIEFMRAEASPEPANDEDDADEALPDWVHETIAYQRSSGSGSQSSGSELSGSSSMAPGSGYFDAVAKMIADVAEALEHAHDQGVIHRDIKPSNLLLAPDGRLSVNDFGLARMLEQPGMTMTGEFVGSPLYMSPEQITAGRAPLDHRTDIYSLGATLYELLTLQPPFPGTSRDQVIGQILHKEPKSPRRLNKRIPADLETICMKAIERDPDRRYQTAGQMAADLRRFVNRHAIQARRLGVVGRTVKWTRRNPALAGLSAVAVISVLGVAVLLAEIARRQSIHESNLAAKELQRAMEFASAYAIAGELSKSEQAINEAIALGATLGWQKMLRGQLEIYRGNYGKAQSLLRESEEIMGPNMSSSALLAICKMESGEEATYFYNVEDLHKMTPRSPEDLLHLGLAEWWSNPFLAVEHLNESVNERSTSPVVRLVRARALSVCAWDSTDPIVAIKYANLAVADAQVAELSLDENYYVPAVLASSHLCLSRAYRETTQTVAAEHHARESESFIERIPEGNHDRFFVLLESGRREEAFDEVMDVNPTNIGHGTYVSSVRVIAHFRRQEYGRAQEVAEGIVEDQGYLKAGFGYLAQLAEKSMENPGVRRTLHDRVIEYLDRKMKDSEQVSNLDIDWAVLRLLGDDAEARRVGRIARKNYSKFQTGLLRGLVPATQVMEGTADIPKLEQQCKHSRMQLAPLYFVAGVEAVANGNRPLAKQYFQRGRDDGYPIFYVRLWSLALVEKLEREPDWPSWVPEKTRGGP